jgi:hypothetical protein
MGKVNGDADVRKRVNPSACRQGSEHRAPNKGEGCCAAELGFTLMAEPADYSSPASRAYWTSGNSSRQG